MYLTRADNALIEYCSFHGQDSKNPAQFHTNVIYCGVITNCTFRYNRLYDIQVEGLFFNDPDNKNIRIYRNLFYQDPYRRTRVARSSSRVGATRIFWCTTKLLWISPSGFNSVVLGATPLASSKTTLYSVAHSTWGPVG